MAGGVINTGSHPKALWPGIKAWWGRMYDEYPVEWKDLFDEESSDKNYEQTVQVTGFGLVPVKAQGGGIEYDSEIQGPVAQYTHLTYGLGYIVTMEELEDDLYEKVSKTRVKALAFSHRQTEETVAANVYNRAFNSSFVGADGVSLLSASHPNTTGGTFSNLLTTPSDLNETALEDLIIQMSLATDDRGLRIKVLPKTLLIHPSNMFNAERILGSVFQNDTANNAINAMKAMNSIPGGIKVNHYFDAPNAWFLRTNVMEGMIRFTRKETKFDQDNDFDTKNLKASAVQRFSVGWTDPRGLYGSEGQ